MRPVKVDYGASSFPWLVGEPVIHKRRGRFVSSSIFGLRYLRTFYYVHFFLSKNGPENGAYEFSPPVHLFFESTW